MLLLNIRKEVRNPKRISIHEPMHTLLLLFLTLDLSWAGDAFEFTTHCFSLDDLLFDLKAEVRLWLDSEASLPFEAT